MEKMLNYTVLSRADIEGCNCPPLHSQKMPARHLQNLIECTNYGCYSSIFSYKIAPPHLGPLYSILEKKVPIKLIYIIVSIIFIYYNMYIYLK